MLDRAPRSLQYLIGLVAAVALTLALAFVLMRPTLEDLAQLAALFALSALASAGIGFLAYRLEWWRSRGSLATSLTIGYVLAAALTMLNVWITARLMFISQHDLALAGLLLLFASVISVSFGALLSNRITSSLRMMSRSTVRLSEGDFSTRVPVSGQDEVAQLAQAFNAMAERLQRGDEEARQMEKARRDFIAWVSHDLRTPMAALRGMIDALAEGVVADPETVGRYLHQCQIEINRMRDLIDDLFELARVDRAELVLDFQTCSLADLISDTIGGFSAQATARDITVTGWVDPAVDPVWVAPQEIGRVLYNLVDNALRHTPSGGEVHLRAKPQGDSVVVSVQDTGDGILPEDLPHVFDRFYRGEKSRSRGNLEGGGAGLGLAIAKSFVEAHGGRIWAESEPPHGTLIMFSLPRPDPQEEARHPV